MNWSAPVGGADGYVILYSTEGGSNMTQLVEGGGQTSSVLTSLSKGQLYTIRVFAYKDIPSLLSDPVHVLHDGEMLCVVLFPSYLISSSSLLPQFLVKCLVSVL